MGKLNLQHEKVILIATAKLFSDQSAYVIGELKQQEKFNFKVAVSAVDSFIKEIEAKLSPDALSTLEILTESLNDGMTQLRKDLTELK